jgi:hypothetical protein
LVDTQSRDLHAGWNLGAASRTDFMEFLGCCDLLVSQQWGR